VKEKRNKGIERGERTMNDKKVYMENDGMKLQNILNNTTNMLICGIGLGWGLFSFIIIFMK